MDWQPIETAPKRPPAVLVWCAERMNTYTAIWMDNGYEEPGWFHFGGSGPRLSEEPTHWMTLPTPPSS